MPSVPTQTGVDVVRGREAFGRFRGGASEIAYLGSACSKGGASYKGSPDARARAPEPAHQLAPQRVAEPGTESPGFWGLDAPGRASRRPTADLARHSIRSFHRSTVAVPRCRDRATAHARCRRGGVVGPWPGPPPKDDPHGRTRGCAEPLPVPRQETSAMFGSHAWRESRPRTDHRLWKGDPSCAPPPPARAHPRLGDHSTPWGILPTPINTGGKGKGKGGWAVTRHNTSSRGPQEPEGP